MSVVKANAIHAHPLLTCQFCFFKDVAVNGINATVAIDNSGSLVTDTGEKRNVVCEWKTPGRFTLPGDTKVVTIKAHNDHGPDDKGGLLASFSNHVVTDETWQCADMGSCTPAHCESVAKWKQAKPYGLNVASTWPWYKKIPEIAETAKWIWVTDSTATRVWCRKTFSK